MGEKLDTRVDLMDLAIKRKKSWAYLSVTGIILSLCVIACVILLYTYTNQELSTQQTELNAVEDRLYELVGIRTSDSPEIASQKFERKMREYDDCYAGRKCHGIQLNQIAYYYSGHKRMKESVRGFRQWKQSEFSGAFGEGVDGCNNKNGASVLSNKYGQLWCNNNGTRHDFFRTEQEEEVFRYWKPSEFTHKNTDYYDLVSDEGTTASSRENSKIIAKKFGVYMILAKVVFKKRLENPTAMIFRNKTLVAQCTGNSIGKQDGNIPCYIFQIVHMEEQTELQMKTTALVRFSIAKTDFYLALWRLHDTTATHG